MEATGKYKVEIEDKPAAVFCDDQNTAIDVAHIFGDSYIRAVVWEKDHSGWAMIYPGNR